MRWHRQSQAKRDNPNTKTGDQRRRIADALDSLRRTANGLREDGNELDQVIAELEGARSIRMG